MPSSVRAICFSLFVIFAPAISFAEGFSTVEPKGKGITYYVSPKGDDGNSGKTTKKAFRTLQRAANITKPGDTVLVAGGNYTASGKGATVLYIDRSGEPGNWITYKALSRNKRPRILVNQHWGGITVGGASYILIDGFDVEGNVKKVSLDYARDQKENLNNPITSGNGISVTNSADDRSQIAHHVIIRNNHVHHCPGGGISTENADYIRIEENDVHDNAHTSPYGQSGISMYLNSNFDDASEIKMIVRNNASYNNRNYVPNFYSKSISDGNGIIIDDTSASRTN